MSGTERTEVDELRERIAKVIHHEGGYCGLCGYEGEWDVCGDCKRTLLGYADAVLNALRLEQVGWRNDQGRMCFGHEHHHRLDGIEWCEPVYRLAPRSDR